MNAADRNPVGRGRPADARNPRRLRRRIAPARALAGAFLAACILQLAAACGDRSDRNGKGKPAGDPEVAAGRALYMSHCIACHSADPSRDGSLGPAVKGSSLELLQARVLRGEYPPGYTPKRSTRIMVKLPMTEEDVAKIHKFLNAP